MKKSQMESKFLFDWGNGGMGEWGTGWWVVDQWINKSVVALGHECMDAVRFVILDIVILDLFVICIL